MAVKKRKKKGQNAGSKENQSQQRGMVKKQWLWIGAAGIAVVVAIAAGWGIFSATFRLSINGLAVTSEEYLQIMNTQKYAVSTELSEQYGLQSGAGFWTNRVGNQDAYQILAERTIAALVERRARYELAKEQGYVDDISYAGICQRLENENTNRAEKVAKGETVYGVDHFTMETFLDYEAEAIRTRYCDEITNPGMDISDEVLKARYEETKEQRFRRDDSLSLTYVLIDCEGEGLDADAVQKRADKLARLTGEHGSLYDLALADPELAPYVEKRDLTYSDYRAASMEIPEILDLTVGLMDGERSEVTNQNGVLILVECTARTLGGYTPYEEARDYLVKFIREETFDALVAERAKAAKVDGSMDIIYKFTKKSV